MLTRLHVEMSRRILVVEACVAGFYPQLSTAVHGITRIDRQVEERGFHLDRVDEGVPKTTAYDGFEFDSFAKGVSQHIIHVSYQPP